MNRAERRAAEKAATRKQKAQRDSVVMIGIPALPAIGQGFKAEDEFITTAIKREWASERFANGTATGEDMNDIIFTLNTLHQLMALYVEYATVENWRRYERLRAVAESIRKRKETTGRYGMTGEQLHESLFLMSVINEFFGRIPLARLGKAENSVRANDARVGRYKYADSSPANVSQC